MKETDYVAIDIEEVAEELDLPDIPVFARRKGSNIVFEFPVEEEEKKRPEFTGQEIHQP